MEQNIQMKLLTFCFGLVLVFLGLSYIGFIIVGIGIGSKEVD